jgi:hypothetical protein
MLFLGGGLTAASMLAQSHLLAPEPEPAIAGAMVAPPPLPKSSPTPLCVKSPEPLWEPPPGVEGGMTLPQPNSEKRPQPGEVPRRAPDAMQSRGAVAMPRPSQQQPQAKKQP